MSRIANLKKKSILEVAADLGIPLRKVSSTVYESQDHDSFRIFSDTNTFKWFSRDIQGDVIDFVKLVKDVPANEAMFYLQNGEFKPIEVVEVKQEPFRYFLQPYEKPELGEARRYLTEVRALSDETIDFFKTQGVLTEAVKKTNAYYEPVIVFKYLDRQGQLTGASLQGIRENRHLYERGRLKQILKNSDGTTGLSVTIGQPKRLVFLEAPIDLMSYYELNKEQLTDVRLVAMEGLKQTAISRYALELIGQLKGQEDFLETVNRSKWKQTLQVISTTTVFFKHHPDFITIAVDNDEAGRNFITKLEEQGLSFRVALPPLLPGQSKSDWNDVLKHDKEVHAFQAPSRNLEALIAQATQESQSSPKQEMAVVYDYTTKATHLFENSSINQEKFAFLLANVTNFDVYNRFAIREDHLNEMMAVTHLYNEYVGNKELMLEAATARGLLADKADFLKQYAKDFITNELNTHQTLEV